MHHVNQLLGATLGQSRSMLENDLQFTARQGVKVELHKSISEGTREDLSAGVEARRILGGKYAEVGVGFDHLLRLGDK